VKSYLTPRLSGTILIDPTGLSTVTGPIVSTSWMKLEKSVTTTWSMRVPVRFSIVDTARAEPPYE